MENVKELELAEFAAIAEALKAVSSHAAPTRETSHATWQEDRGMNDRQDAPSSERDHAAVHRYGARAHRNRDIQRYEGSLFDSRASRSSAP